MANQDDDHKLTRAEIDAVREAIGEQMVQDLTRIIRAEEQEAREERCAGCGDAPYSWVVLEGKVLCEACIPRELVLRTPWGRDLARFQALEELTQLIPFDELGDAATELAQRAAEIRPLDYPIGEALYAASRAVRAQSALLEALTELRNPDPLDYRHLYEGEQLIYEDTESVESELESSSERRRRRRRQSSHPPAAAAAAHDSEPPPVLGFKCQSWVGELAPPPDEPERDDDQADDESEDR